MPVLLQGRLAIGGSFKRSGVMPSALSIVNNKLKVTFLGRPIGSAKRQRLYTIHAPLSSPQKFAARVTGIPSSARRRGGCDTSVEDIDGHRTEEHSHSELTIASVPTPITRVVTISTDADPEWFATYGAESNAEIARAINITEAIFLRDFRVSFRIVKQHTYTDSSPYSASFSAELLQQFATNPENPSNLSDNSASFARDVNLKHLFTGKDLSGSAVGVAYIGALCVAPDLAYGVTQHYIRDATFGIFAHEIAHNFGASHDLKSPRTIMYPTLGLPPSGQFSQRSLFAIRAFVDRFGSCLSRGAESAPIPPELELPEDPELDWRVSLNRKIFAQGRARVRFSGAVVSPNLAPGAGVEIALKRNDLIIASTTTDDKGRYTFNIPARSFLKRLATMQTSTEDGHGQSPLLYINPSAVKRALSGR